MCLWFFCHSMQCNNNLSSNIIIMLAKNFKYRYGISSPAARDAASVKFLANLARLKDSCMSLSFSWRTVTKQKMRVFIFKYDRMNKESNFLQKSICKLKLWYIFVYINNAYGWVYPYTIYTYYMYTLHIFNSMKEIYKKCVKNFRLKRIYPTISYKYLYLAVFHEHMFNFSEKVIYREKKRFIAAL